MNSIRAAAFMALALAACNLSNPGYDAPAGELAYPVAIALSDPSGASRAGYLYVANANFDLRYNGGSVQSYDLDALEDALREGECIAAEADPIEPDASAEPPLPDAGGADAGDADVSDVELDGGATDGELPDANLDGEAEGGDAGLPDTGVDARVAPVEVGDAPELAEALPARPLLCDGRDKDTDRVKRCCFAPHLADPEASRFADLDPVRVNEIKTDSYATGIATSPDAMHVYVALRAQSRLLHLDVDEGGRLSCGENTGRCRRGPRSGREAEIDGIELPATPTAVITGSFADLNLDAREERYFAATAHDNGQVSLFALNDGSGMPKFLHATDAFQSASRSVAPSSLRLDNGFLLVSAPVASSIARIGVRADVPANDERATAGVYLYRSASINVAGLSFSSDIRDVQADERDRAAGESRRYYALLRGSSGAIIQSVGFLELDGTTEDGFFARAVDAVRVGVGMSKLVQANLGGRQLLFVSCYADGEIHVLDADRRRTVTVIRDVLGPFDMQVDVARRLLYVTDFRASVVRVIDLSGLARGSSGVPRAVATLGAPYTPGRVK